MPGGIATNFHGHLFGGIYQFTDSIDFRVWALVAQPLMAIPMVSNDYYWRVRADLTFTF